jgi:hypothetical protein
MKRYIVTLLAVEKYLRVVEVEATNATQARWVAQEAGYDNILDDSYDETVALQAIEVEPWSEEGANPIPQRIREAVQRKEKEGGQP